MAGHTRREILVTASATVLIGCTGPTSGTDTPTNVTTDPTTDTTTDAATDTSTTDPGACDPTGADIEGPYWVEGVPVRGDLDLYGDPGPRLALEGRVLDADCAPIAGAIVEIWHADDEGAYDDAADGKYRGQVAADADGNYAFTTIVPGRYLNGATYRPSHVHAKVWVEGELRLTTQLYFGSDPYNEGDTWFDEDRVIADLDDGDELVGAFDFVV